MIWNLSTAAPCVYTEWKYNAKIIQIIMVRPEDHLLQMVLLPWPRALALCCIVGASILQKAKVYSIVTLKKCVKYLLRVQLRPYCFFCGRRGESSIIHRKMFQNFCLSFIFTKSSHERPNCGKKQFFPRFLVTIQLSCNDYF